ncbi:MAG: extracellular solute-binding protein [Spirochaetales bacterium]|nr:extracellular solute-binding protein [Spirochaetales bacterium]
MRKLLLLGLVLLLTCPFAFSGGAQEGAAPGKFEVLYFVGGMGEMANAAVDMLKQNHPDVDISLEYSHKAQDILRNKIMAGEPPDVAHVNQGLFDYYGAITEGLLAPIDFIYDAPTLDGKGKMRDVFYKPDMDSSGYVDGKHYLIPEVSYLGGMWYSQKLVDDLGVTVPETWNEFMAAAAKFEQNGIEAFAYMGDFAHEYPLNYFLFPMINSLSHQAYVDIQNLEPDAWKSGAVKEAMERFASMRDKGYIWPPSLTAKIEVQQEFLKYNIGMYPCGSWLYAEMGDSWPADFGLTFFPTPGKKTASGDNYVWSILLRGSVPKPVRNQALVIEYYQYLLNDKETIRKNIEANKFIMPIKGFADDFGHLLPDAVTSAVAALNTNPSMVSMWSAWYKTLPKEAGNAINALVSGDQEPSDFMKRMTEATKAVIDDDTIPKYTFE